MVWIRGVDSIVDPPTKDTDPKTWKEIFDSIFSYTPLNTSQKQILREIKKEGILCYQIHEKGRLRRRAYFTNMESKVRKLLSSKTVIEMVIWKRTLEKFHKATHLAPGRQ